MKACINNASYSIHQHKCLGDDNSSRTAPHVQVNLLSDDGLVQFWSRRVESIGDEIQLNRVANICKLYRLILVVCVEYKRILF
jgi:hypothetical protein